MKKPTKPANGRHFLDPRGTIDAKEFAYNVAMGAISGGPPIPGVNDYKTLFGQTSNTSPPTKRIADITNESKKIGRTKASKSKVKTKSGRKRALKTAIKRASKPRRSKKA